MLRNLVEVLRLLSTTKPSASSAGLELLLAARGSEDGAAQLAQKQSSQAYVQREADAAWDCVQVSRQPVTAACPATPPPATASCRHMCSCKAEAACKCRIGHIQPAMFKFILLCNSVLKTQWQM